MKQTAMQDLKEDLLESIVSGTEALQEIESELIKNTCVAMLERVMKNVVKRIDEELLEMEKQQIIDACNFGYYEGCAYMSDIKSKYESFEQYYDEKFKNEKL